MSSLIGKSVQTAPVCVSVIVPVYQTSTTLIPSLRALGEQSLQPLEIIVVDSSPDDRRRQEVRLALPDACYHYEPVRLGHQAARNRGAELARGELLAILDPDIYVGPGWLEALVNAFRQTGGVIFGPVHCFGARWTDRVANMAKFEVTLPERTTAYQIDSCWSGNMLMHSAHHRAIGGFFTGAIQGDAFTAARFTAAGIDLWLEPAAVGYHDHENIGWLPFLRERFRRGREMASGEGGSARWRRSRLAYRVLTSPLMPIRLAASLWTTGRRLAGTSHAREFVMTAPGLLLARAVWLLGMEFGYWALWLRPETRVSV
jgi:glycosyltransferase involved in cell wall biosynthesis